jgi:MFS family permease
LGLVLLVLGLPLTFLLRKRPEDLALLPDGARPTSSADKTAASVTAKAKTNIVDAQWVAIEWTLARAMRTARFWWIASGYFCTMYAWYAVQVHQTKYLVEIGFSSTDAAWALGAVSLAGIPGQIALGHVSDRIGRESIWVLSNLGFVATYLLLLALGTTPSTPLLYLMILLQGVIGYGVTSIFGAIPAEIFEGKHYGTIFGTLMLGAISGGAVGPWLTGLLFDRTGNYVMAFWIAVAASVYAGVAILFAAPGKVRAVAGRMKTVS